MLIVADQEGEPFAVMRSLIWLGEKIYLLIPFRPVREAMFGLFTRLVRNKTTTLDLPWGRFALDLGEMIDVQLFFDRFEPEVTKSLRRLAKPGMTVVDIGANVGAHTLLLASLVGPSGRVIAFEPTDFAWAKLQRNLSLNAFSWVTTVKAALGEKEIRGKRVDFRASWRSDGTRADGPSVVHFLRLDDWCEKKAIRGIDLIKIDVDGNEYGALSSGRRLIQRDKPVIMMEVVAPHFEDGARNPLAFLETMDYRFQNASCEQWLTMGDIRDRLPANDPAMTKSINIFALPK